MEAFLQNPFYAGVIRLKHSGEVFAGGHEPLISKVTFDRVNAVRQRKGSKKVTRHQHLYRGLFSCGHCGRSMIAELQKGYVYYRCHFQSCPPNSVREEMLTGAIVETLATVAPTDEAVEVIAQQVSEWSKKRSTKDDNHTAKMQLGQMDHQLAKLEDAAIAGIIEPDNFQRRKEKLLLERAAQAQKLDDDKRFAVTPSVIRKFLERLKNVAAHYQFGTLAEKRELVEIVFSNRRVQEKNVYIEPANWLVQVHEAAAVLMCAEARATHRRSRKSEDDKVSESIEKLAAIAQASSLRLESQREAITGESETFKHRRVSH